MENSPVVVRVTKEEFELDDGGGAGCEAGWWGH